MGSKLVRQREKFGLAENSAKWKPSPTVSSHRPIMQNVLFASQYENHYLGYRRQYVQLKYYIYSDS